MKEQVVAGSRDGMSTAYLSPLAAEAMACRDGLQDARSRGVERIQLETSLLISGRSAHTRGLKLILYCNRWMIRAQVF